MIKKFCGYCGNPLGNAKTASLGAANRTIGRGNTIAEELRLHVDGEEFYFITDSSNTFGTFYLIKTSDGTTSLSNGGHFTTLNLSLVGDDPQSFTKQNFDRYVKQNSLDNYKRDQDINGYLQYEGRGILDDDSGKGVLARILAAFVLHKDGNLIEKAIRTMKPFSKAADIQGNALSSGSSIGRSSRPELQGDEDLPELLEMPPGEAFVSMMGERSVESLLSKGYGTLAKIQNGDFKNAVSAQMIRYLKAKKINPRAHDIFDKEKDFKSLLLLIVLTNKVSDLIGTKWNTFGGEEVAEVEQISAPGELKNFDLGNGKKAGLYFVGIEDV